jgi:predicted HAD superfamily Cof-like phosphohydrolase
MSEAERVKDFTLGAGRDVPNRPRQMTRDEVLFLVGMKLSEIVELVQTVTDTTDEAVELVRNRVTVDLKRNYKKPEDVIQIMADQADAVVDCNYYGYDAFAKCGINLSKVFDVVHQANMNKRFSDGTFHKRDDGKIIKPEGWVEPNIYEEIQRQMNNGSW